MQPTDRSQTVTARSPFTRRARVEERTAVANRSRQIEHGSQGLVPTSVPMHVQEMLGRMRGRHRKRGIHPSSIRSAKAGTQTTGRTQEGCGARQCNDNKAVRGAANAAPTTADSRDSSVMSSAMAERRACRISKSSTAARLYTLGKLRNSTGPVPSPSDAAGLSGTQT